MPAIDTRPERPRTRPTGVLPRRPQVLARGGVIDWLASSSKTFTAAVLLPAARPPTSTAPPRRRRARSGAGWAAATTSRAAAAAATYPPPCTRRGTGGRSSSSPAPASTAGQSTRGPADRSPTPFPAGLSACPTVEACQANPFDATPARSSSHHWRRQRSTDRSETGNAAAISRFFSPASKPATAWSRTRSRPALSASVKPPPCGYLTPPGLPKPPARTVRRTARHHSIKFSTGCAGTGSGRNGGGGRRGRHRLRPGRPGLRHDRRRRRSPGLARRVRGRGRSAARCIDHERC
jgi:hypothetical protein